MTDSHRDPTQSEDLPADAHLRQALRNAPDAEALPPTAVREAILRQARAAVPAARPAAPRARVRFIDRLFSFWDWLARPAVATGFASLMIATMVGLMWWDRPLEEALPPRERPAPAAPVPVRPPGNEATPAAQAPPAPEAAMPRTPPRPALKVPAEEKEHRLRRDGPATPEGTNPSGAAERTRPPPPQRETMPDAGRDAMAPAAAPAPAPAPEHAPIVAQAPSPRPDAPVHSAPESRSEAGALPDTSRAARTRSQGVAPPAAAWAPLSTPSGNDTPAVRMAQLKASLAREPGRWTWQSEGSAPQPVTPSLTAWVAQLDAAVPRWQPMAGRTDAPSTELRLRRDGQRVHTWRLQGQAVQWHTEGGAHFAARLSGSDMASLHSALQEALR